MWNTYWILITAASSCRQHKVALPDLFPLIRYKFFVITPYHKSQITKWCIMWYLTHCGISGKRFLYIFCSENRLNGQNVFFYFFVYLFKHMLVWYTFVAGIWEGGLCYTHWHILTWVCYISYTQLKLRHSLIIGTMLVSCGSVVCRVMHQSESHITYEAMVVWHGVDSILTNLYIAALYITWFRLFIFVFIRLVMFLHKKGVDQPTKLFLWPVKVKQCKDSRNLRYSIILFNILGSGCWGSH